MSLPASTKKLVEKRLQEYCDQRIPLELRDEIRVNFKIRGNSITLFEQRPFYKDPSTWIESSVAKFRYDPKMNEWTLYWRDRNSRWHEYEEIAPDSDFNVLLQEVNEDPNGIFWG